jgi:hypothetical protein
VEHGIEAERLIIRYLLGDISEKERDEIEDLYRDDDDFFERLLITEDELLDAYVQGELSDQERGRFEDFFLISDTRRERLENARLLLNMPPASPVAEKKDVATPKLPLWKQLFSRFWPTQNRGLQWAVGIVVLVVAFGILRLALVSVKHSPADGLHRVASFELSPGAVRGGNELQKLIIPQGVERIELKLYLPSDIYKSYHAEVQKAAAGLVLIENGLTAQPIASSKVIILTLPGDTLSSGSYVITVFGETEEKEGNVAAEYQFKVERG